MRRFLFGAALAGLAAGLVSCGAPQDGNRHTTAAKTWPAVGGDWSNSHYSTLTKITPANVKDLGAAWTVPFHDEHSRATPVVTGGRMFVTAGAHVYALNPKTGEILWSVAPDVPPQGLFKGVAVGDGLVFVGLSDSTLIALDQVTGAQKWSQFLGDAPLPGTNPAGSQWIAGAPAYVQGIVIGEVSGARAPSERNDGRIVGLDAKTGAKVWTFHVVPGPGEPGHETWPQESDVWKTGGGAVWSTPAADPDLGLVYIGTGNAMPEWGGEVRAGDNLYNASVVALDIKTGALRWHFQATHHDIFEHDLGTPLVLYDADVGGKTRKALGVMRTDGYLFLLDRGTGAAIFPIEERPVPQNARLKTAATQPFPVGADQIGPNCVQPDMAPEGFKLGCYFDPIDVDPPNLLIPLSTIRSSPMAYSPQTQMFYVTGTVAPLWVRRWEDPYVFSALSPAPFLKKYGLLNAVDARTNKIVWQKHVPYPVENGSGFTATASGLLFHGEPDGNMQALDATTGEVLWQFQTGANQSGPVAVYEVDGEQYVAALATNALWAFKLGGTVQPLPAPTPPPTETSLGGRIVETDHIDMNATFDENRSPKLTRHYTDEYAFKPLRAKVTVGTKVTWTNTGTLPHSADAVDGAWSTGVIAPGKSAVVIFDKPGTYIYRCKEHPWSYGEITVE